MGTAGMARLDRIRKAILFLVLAIAVGNGTAVGHPAIRPNSAHFVAQAEQVVRDLAEGRFGAVEARFDARMATDLPLDKLSSLWKEFTARKGTFDRIAAHEITPGFGVYYMVAMTLAFQRSKQADAVITFGEAGQIFGLYFGPRATDTAKGWTIPSYAQPGRFHEEAITISHGPWHLPGTLTLPNGRGPFPAVLLVPGSPPVDQDVTVGSNKIFKDLAWGLASRGIAVLRYAKRTHQFGAGLGGGNGSSFTVQDELIDDARAAASLLATRTEVDSRQMYLLGHSLGGVAVPQMAADDPHIAGVIIMGAPAGDLLNDLIRRFAEDADEDATRREESAKLASTFKQIQRGDLPSAAIVDFYGLPSPVGYWLDERRFEPAATAAKLKARVLVLVGGHDAEVGSNDFQDWRTALTRHANAAVHFYSDLFHLFMRSTATKKGKDLLDDWSRPAHVAPEVINDVALWVLSGAGQQTKTG
jgi:dienelactone hydrolase